MPSGYDLSDKLGYRLMQGRLGIYDKFKSENLVHDSDFKGLDSQFIRLNYEGGSA